MEPDALDASDAEEREPEVVLQVAELSFHGRAAAVQVAPFRGAVLDRRLELNPALAERNYRGDAALVARVYFGVAF